MRIHYRERPADVGTTDKTTLFAVAMDRPAMDDSISTFAGGAGA